MNNENSTQNPFFPQGYDPSGTGFKPQFGHPRGWLGWLVGRILALGKNRSLWVLSKLDLKTDDRVLEIGFGPGLDIERVSEQITSGFVRGIDYSKLMVEEARKRNAQAIGTGKVELKHSSMAEPLPYPDETFTKYIRLIHFSSGLIRWRA